MKQQVSSTKSGKSQTCLLHLAPVCLCIPQTRVVHYRPVQERIERVVRLALRLATLRYKPNAKKRIAIILTNSPGKAARIGNAVGLDAPASLLYLLKAMRVRLAITLKIFQKAATS